MRIVLIILVVGIVLAASAMVVGTRVTENASFCASCHPMRQYLFSLRSSAHANLTCNDCHVPTTPVLRQLYEGKSGMSDTIAYYLTGYEDTLHAKKDTQAIVKGNCLRCHRKLMRMVEAKERRCAECHRDVPHGVLRTLHNATWPRELE